VCAPIETRCTRGAVFDLDAGPVTITSPDADVATWPQVIDEDHYVAGVVYDAGAHVHQ
jgi:hypothetical protein